MTSSRNNPIPTIDLSFFLHPTSSTSRLQTAKALVDACRRVGFVYIINHDIASSTIESAFAMSKQLFDLSHEQKMQAEHPPGPTVHRGYSYPGLEKVYQVITEDVEVGEKLREVRDCKESYEIGSPLNPSQPNIWLPPTALPNFQPTMESLYSTLSTLTQTLLLALGTGLDLQNPSQLADFHSGHGNQLRLLHYPPILASEIEAGRAARMPAHSDWGSITLVFQDECGGLEVEDPEHPGVFAGVEPIKDAVVMNVGDLLMRWSNDTLKSTLHRVQLPPLASRYNPIDDGAHDDAGAHNNTKTPSPSAPQPPKRITHARYSIPYFCAPDIDRTITVLPECIPEGQKPKYKPILAGEYYRMRGALQYRS